MADQLAFAALSGDYNPMHVDALAARRTQAGAPVVHGMHVLLWALDALAAAELIGPQLCEIRAQFRKFTYLDVACDLDLTHWDADAARAELCSNGLVLTTIQLRNGQRQVRAEADSAKLAAPEVALAGNVAARARTARPRRLPRLDHGSRCGRRFRVSVPAACSRHRIATRQRACGAVAPGRNGVSRPALDLCGFRRRPRRVESAAPRPRLRRQQDQPTISIDRHERPRRRSFRHGHGVHALASGRGAIHGYVSAAVAADVFAGAVGPGDRRLARPRRRYRQSDRGGRRQGGHHLRQGTGRCRQACRRNQCGARARRLHGACV